MHGCVGADRRRDPERVAAVVSELRADAIGLQEVDSRHEGESRQDQIERIAEGSGLDYVAGVTLEDHRGEYGNAVLTRLPILGVREVDLSLPGLEPRGALEVTLETLQRPLRFVVTHLGLGLRERSPQVETLLAWLAAGERSHPLVLLGDLNEWNPRAGSLRRLHDELGPSRGVRSFPSRFPLLALDRIFATPPARLVGLRAWRGALARRASDHLPVVAELGFEPDSPQDRSLRT